MNKVLYKVQTSIRRTSQWPKRKIIRHFKEIRCPGLGCLELNHLLPDFAAGHSIGIWHRWEGIGRRAR